MAKQYATLRTLLQNWSEGALDMSSPLTRRECFERYRWHEDVFSDGEGIFLRVAMHWSLQFDSKPTVVLRDHGSNMGKAVQRNHDMLMVILDRLETHADFPNDCTNDLKNFRADVCRKHAWSTLRVGGSAVWARAQLRRAIKLRPRLLTKPRTLAAIGLAALPNTIRLRLNRLGNRLTDRPENRTFVENY